MELNLPLDLEAEFRARAKKVIRARMKSVRGSYPRSSLVPKSAAIIERLLALPEVTAATGVALFWPMLERGEVDLRVLDERLRARGTRLFYPFLERTSRGYRTGFRESLAAGDVVLRDGRFAEPPPDAPEAQRGEVQVVVVPALAVDGNGHRIGYGAGYYDATLPDLRPPAVAVAVVYDFQLEGELPAEPHDERVDAVVTERRLLRVAGASAPSE